MSPTHTQKSSEDCTRSETMCLKIPAKTTISSWWLTTRWMRDRIRKLNLSISSKTRFNYSNCAVIETAAPSESTQVPSFVFTQSMTLKKRSWVFLLIQKFVFRTRNSQSHFRFSPRNNRTIKKTLTSIAGEPNHLGLRHSTVRSYTYQNKSKWCKSTWIHDCMA